jgi:hypothetical protein
MAPAGTGTTIEVVLQLVGAAAIPLNATVLAPCVEPKFVPVIVTGVPTGPRVGDRLLIVGAVKTVKIAPLLDTPPTVTTTFPLVAPLGTGTVIEFALQLLGVAVVPLNVTVLAPCIDPKFVPMIITEDATAPEVGDKLVTLGVGRTVNNIPALETLFTATTTLPVIAPFGTGTVMLVALQLLGVAVVPLKVNVLVPCVDPKFVPVIVIGVPTGPDVGDKLVMLGVGRTAKTTPLLAAPPAVTTTLPVVAAEGTVATITVEVQLTMLVASVPLKETVLFP